MLKAALFAATALIAAAPAAAAIIYQESGVTPIGKNHGEVFVPLVGGETRYFRFDISSDDVIMTGRFRYRYTQFGSEVYPEHQISTFTPLSSEMTVHIPEGATNYFGGGTLSWDTSIQKFDPVTLEVKPVNWTLRISNTPFAAAVPEPTSWVLMITGFGLAGAALRRRATPALA